MQIAEWLDLVQPSTSNMAQPQVQPSGSEVSKVENDIAQPVSLADTVVTLIREPVTLLYQNITKSQELKLRLGHWQEKQLMRQNVSNIGLRLKEVEEYIMKMVENIPGCIRTDDKSNLDSKRPSLRESFRLSWGSTRVQIGSPRPDKIPTGQVRWVYLLFALGIRAGMGIIGWRIVN